MKLRNKILSYFSVTVICLLSASLLVVYILFSAHRKEEFHQQQIAKIKYTIGLIGEFEQMSSTLSSFLDRQDINDFYDEKLLVYDQNKKLIFASIDSLEITRSQELLASLSSTNKLIETREGKYDVVAAFIQRNNVQYFAISKAYDALGYSKKFFLEKILILMFIAIAIIIVLISLYLSNIITKPITVLARKLSRYDLNAGGNAPLNIRTTTYELNYLTEKFNELLKRIGDAFSFQKQAIQHISHQLKTPVAVLVSDLERLSNQTTDPKLRESLSAQVIQAKSLAEIMDVLLEVSKMESATQPQRTGIRVDELMFDIIEELNGRYPHFQFEVNYVPDVINEEKLICLVNKMLLKEAFRNILINCIRYSDNNMAGIQINGLTPGVLSVQFINSGETISEDELPYLFSHFFRGKNSHGKAGFGLGLALAKRIIELNDGKILYRINSNNENVFEVQLPLHTPFRQSH